MVHTNYSCGVNLDNVTWTIYTNVCVLMPRKMNFIVSVACGKMTYVQYLLVIFCFFIYSFQPSKVLRGIDGKQTIPSAGARGLRIVALTICSHEQTQ